MHTSPRGSSKTYRVWIHRSERAANFRGAKFEITKLESGGKLSWHILKISKSRHPRPDRSQRFKLSETRQRQFLFTQKQYQGYRAVNLSSNSTTSEYLMETQTRSALRSTTTEDPVSPPEKKKMRIGSTVDAGEQIKPIQYNAARFVSAQVSVRIAELCSDSHHDPTTRRKVSGKLLGLLKALVDYGDDTDCVKEEVLSCADGMRYEDSTIPFMGSLMDVYRQLCESFD